LTRHNTLPWGGDEKIKHLRSLADELAELAANIPLLMTKDLERTDLIYASGINRHTSAAMASLSMAAEEAALFLEATHDSERVKAERRDAMFRAQFGGVDNEEEPTS